MKVYTGKGDHGTTSLVGGARVAKDHPRIEAYGTVDELMAWVAYLRDNMHGQTEFDVYRDDLLAVLDHLMRMTAVLAAEEEATKYVPEFSAGYAVFLEKRIDDIEPTLPKIDRFTLPGGHPLISLCHIVRTVSRRAERNICTMDREYAVPEAVRKYINRLSDYFYVLGRKLTDELNVKELLWDYEK